MISINSKDELSLYNLEGKWNDYIAVQKGVITVLKEENYFEDNVPNYHTNGIYSFAYLRNEIKIDNELVDVRISVMKRIDSNWFWIHHIDEKEKSPKLLDPSRKTEFKEI